MAGKHSRKLFEKKDKTLYSAQATKTTSDYTSVSLPIKIILSVVVASLVFSAAWIGVFFAQGSANQKLLRESEVVFESLGPKKAIKMIEDDNGFIYPSIYKEKCIDCNLCKKVCPAINKIKYNESDDINLDCINDYDSYNSVEIKREKEVTIQRLVRNTTIAKEIKGIYDNRCQLCECQLKSSNGGYKSEAHHIKPYNRTHNGDDCCDNLIVLCPNCHTQFDDLYYAINPKTYAIACTKIDLSKTKPFS